MKKKKIGYKERQILIEFVNLILEKGKFEFTGKEAITFADLSVQIKDIIDNIEEK